MEEFLRTHKDVAFGWVLAVEMGALWLQALLGALSASRQRRDAAGRGELRSKITPLARSTRLPRLMAPR